MKKSLSIALIILLAALLGTMLIMDKQKEDRREAHMEELQEEALPFNQELADIRSELQDRENEIKSVPDVSSGIIGFVPTSVDDFSTVKELTAGYEFTPLIVLNGAMDEDTLQDITRKAIQEGFDLVLAGITFDSEVLERADSIRSLLTEYGYAQEPAFFLRSTCDTEENRDALKQHGYQYLVRYSDSLSSGVDDSGVPYISYGFIRTSNIDSNLIRMVVTAHSYTVMTFDFADIHNGSVGETDITDFLEIVENRVSAGEMLYTDLKEAFNAVVEGESLSKSRQEEFEQYKVEQQKRIEELEEIISEIYSRWDEY